jgi:alpha-glucosidase (family GH31 glycosyl hydrolase)
MATRRNFLKAVSSAAVASSLTRRTRAASPAQAANAVTGASVRSGVLYLELGTDVLRVSIPSPGILRTDLLANGREDPHTPVLPPEMYTPGDPSTRIDISGDPIRITTADFQVQISRNPCRFKIVNAAGKVLLEQTAQHGFRVDSKNQGRTGFSFLHNKRDNFYGIRNSGCFSSDPYNYKLNPMPRVRNRPHTDQDTCRVEASVEGGGGAPFVWTTAGYGIMVDCDGGYFQIEPEEIGFYYGNPPAAYYGRHYFRPNSLTAFIFIGEPRKVFQCLARTSGMMEMFPKWAYGFTNSQLSTNQELLRGYLETYRATDIPIDNFTLDFDWKDWGASHYGEFRWNPVKYSQALYTAANPDALINWTRQLECKITGIMKPRIILCTIKGKMEPMTTQGASARKLGIFFPGEKPFVDYMAHLMSHNLDFYKPICRQWYWHATWTHGCMQHGIVGFWNDEADLGSLGNFEFMHMQQSLYEGQRRDLPGKRVWSMNRNFFLGSQRYAYATWSGDINSGFEVMRLQTSHMLSTIALGQMRWAQDTGGFNGHPSPECYTRWFQFTAVCPTLRTHSSGDPRQPWAFGDQACETVKLAIRQRYSWFFYVYALEHAACVETGVGIVRPMTFDYPDDPTVADMTDQWMFGDWIMAAPVLEKFEATRKNPTRRVYLPEGQWIDYFRGDRYSGGQWIDYQLNTESWMDWPLFIKAGAIIPIADPVRAIHTAKPEKIFVDVYPAATRTVGEFYDDDGQSYDYQRGEFHRQKITAMRAAAKTSVQISESSGAYRSSVKHFVLRVHGQAAAQVRVNAKACRHVADVQGLSGVDSGQGEIIYRQSYMTI